MGNALFDRRTAADWSASGQSIDFTEELGSFERLSAAVSDDLDALSAADRPGNWRQSPVSGRLTFAYAGTRGDVPLVAGSAETHVYAVCQRCLAPFTLRLAADFRWLLADSADDASEETWELDGGLLKPSELVDEMLVMAMPFAATHDDEDCKAAEPEVSAADTTRPFADLRRRMDKDNEGR